MVSFAKHYDDAAALQGYFWRQRRVIKLADSNTNDITE
jgi:hypothetical protein